MVMTVYLKTTEWSQIALHLFRASSEDTMTTKQHELEILTLAAEEDDENPVAAKAVD